MIVVIGAGVAGLSAVAQLVAAKTPVTLVTAGIFGGDGVAAGNTALAQGGIAAALGPNDSPELHAADTLAAGAGLVDHDVAHLLAREGIQAVQGLINAGFLADTDVTGQLALGLEAVHSRPRIVHAGEDSTGAVLSEFLTTTVQRHIDDGDVRLIDQAELRRILVDNRRVVGIEYENVTTGTRRLTADAVILATGGYAGLFATSSASEAITGAGLLAAASAGAVLADLEFIQFHPTVLAESSELISEAVRGAGAVLRDHAGQRFMVDVHPDAELAPRDVVSKAAFATMQASGHSHVWLDATVIEASNGTGTLARRFPVLTARLATRGIDWRTQWVPVAPAAHYCMGGIATDASGRTSVTGLFAAGEVSATGVHGANRLASNSLLEGLVFGSRAATAAMQYPREGTWPQDETFHRFIATATELPHRAPDAPHDDHESTHESDLSTLRQLTQRYLGITRTAKGLQTLLTATEHTAHPLAELVSAIATAALHRTESRGGHHRSDYPTTDPAQATRTAWRFAPATLTQKQQARPATKELLTHVNV